MTNLLYYTMDTRERNHLSSSSIAVLLLMRYQVWNCVVESLPLCYYDIITIVIDRLKNLTYNK